MAPEGIEPLRASQLGSSAAAQVLARVFQFVSLALIVRLVVQSYGADRWGTLASVMAIGGVLQLFDFSVNELAAYLAATSSTRRELAARLGRAMTFCVLPGAVGTLAFLGAVAAGPWLLSHHATSTSDLRWLLTSLLAGFLLSLPLSVWTGTLQGLGWLREFSFANGVEWAVELALVAACIATEQNLVTLQWVRTLRLLARGITLTVLLHRRGIPIALPGGLDRAGARELFNFAGGYSVSRGLGLAIYRAPVLLASATLPPSVVGAVAAADQVASLAYRVSHVFYESLFHRFARYLKSGASPAELTLGQQQLSGMTLTLAGLVAVPGMGLCLLGGWIFELWLGRALPFGAEVLPWLTWAWVLNAVASPSSCALLATGHTRQAIVPHALALALYGPAMALGVSLGAVGLGAATLAANLALCGGLVTQAAAVARVSFLRVVRPVSAVAATVAAAQFVLGDVELHPLIRAVAGAAVAGLVVITVVRTNPDIEALLAARAHRTV